MKKVTANEIRRFVIARLDSFRCGDQWVIRSGKIAEMMGYSGYMRNTCQVLKGEKFLNKARLKLVDRTDPDDSTTTTFTYERSGSTRVAPTGADCSAEEAGEQDGGDLEARIRRQVIENLDCVAPLRRVIRAGEVADRMGLRGRTAEICGALASRAFQEEAGIELEEAVFVYVPTVARSAPDLPGTGDFVAGVARAASIEAARAFGDRYGESGTDAAETRPETSPDHDPSGGLPDGGESSGSVSGESAVAPAPDATGPAKALPAVDLCLVSCVKSKRSSAAAAKDLYISDWFIKARRVVEMEGWRWFVLSAKHGLLDPEEEVAPYEKTLDTMSAAERRSWASGVWKALEPHLSGVRSVVFLAGKKYREHFERRLRDRGIEIQVPMEGLVRGDQLAWLKRRMDRR